MGGSSSKQKVESIVAIGPNDLKLSFVDDTVPKKNDPLPAQGGSPETVGVSVQEDHANQNSGELMLPVSNIHTEQFLTALPYHYDNVDGQLVLVSHDNTEPNVVDQQQHKQQPVHPVSFDNKATVPQQYSAEQAKDDVHNDIQGFETQRDGYNDAGVVFKGRTYRKTVFDPHLKENVYVADDDIIAIRRTPDVINTV